MNKLLLVALVASFAAGSALASPECESKAVGKDGKPLAGAAKSSFIKKCEKESGSADTKAACEAKAISKDGKPLSGAAKASSVKKCMGAAK